ncbi:MAG: 30S ribosomal protein S6 [Victivallaceae bacterium]|nr:30S ribosomal protein S6 [Victivallaceae bacterium]
MKKYEAVFIMDIRKVDDEGDALSKEIVGLIESLGGKVTAAVPMGRRQFTYDIEKHKAGIYWDYAFELEEAKVIEIKKKYRLDERVLRNLIVIDERPEAAASKLAE